MEWLDVAWTWIVTDGWQFIVSILAGTGAAKLFVDYSFKKRLEQDKQVLNKELESHKKELNIELESHKQALSVMTENSKFDYQRMMLDFSLYRNKKHEIYPELFKKLYVAVRELSHLSVSWDQENLDMYSIVKIEKYLFEEEEIRHVSEDCDEKDVGKIKIKMMVEELKEAQQKFQDALDYFTSSQLFIPAEISKDIINLLSLGNDLATMRTHQIFVKTTNNKIEHTSSEAKIQFRLNEISKIMWRIERSFKKELSLAEYDENFLKKA
ncbi:MULTISPECIES: hypothetical protein [unclassified Paenibacillus]|uniref:hypothetical protein n=1 Tax=unclassified Paenibacillus TaxID=185978 RepID=UPI00020D7544|nr:MULTISPECIES: hypothetical protein [unclassified Paenibacillus]EGL19292.1 hypothetical protein HMPREF9413_1419 [Paenibacillus sp. HGF7]EPD90107.1 hypothetical protein HMPREF1207_01376 [Paenibacillus sp. HGH0039]